MTTPSTSSSCECGGEIDEVCVCCGEQLHSDSAGRIAGCDNQHHEFRPVAPSQSVSPRQEEARAWFAETFVARVQAEHQRQISLGYDREHDSHHAAFEFTALLTKQVGDLAMAAHFEIGGDGDPTKRYEDVLVQLVTVALKAASVDPMRLTTQPLEEPK